MNINQATFMQVCAELHRTISDLEEAALRLARNTIPDQRRSHIHRINKHRDLVAEAYGKLQALVEEPKDGEIAGQEKASAAPPAPEGSDASGTASTTDQATGTGDTGSIAPAASGLSGQEDGTGNSGAVHQSGSSIQSDDGKKEVDAGAGKSNAGTVSAVDASNNTGTGSNSGDAGTNQGSSGPDAENAAGTQANTQANSVPVAATEPAGTSAVPVVNGTTIPATTNVGNISQSKLLSRNK